MHHLQQTVGNQAVLRLLRSGVIQAKLVVSQPGDISEQEAERVADAVVTSSASPALQRQWSDYTGKGKGLVQRNIEVASGTTGASTPDNFLPQSSGEPLHTNTRSVMESRLGVDLSNVRVHSDSAAYEAASALNARAFTHQNHIWLGRGESQSNLHLMAHEVTHVVQQSDGLRRSLLQRAEATSGPAQETGASAAVGDLKTGLREADKIIFENIEIPAFKKKDHRGALYDSHKPLIRRRNYTRGEPKQREKWQKEIKKDKIISVLEEKAKAANKGAEAEAAKKHVFTVPSSGGKPFLIGTIEEVATELTIPYWGGQSKAPPTRLFDVDHIVELQLANWEGSGWANELGNMELLEHSANRSSGGLIASNINKKVETFTKATIAETGGAAESPVTKGESSKTPAPKKKKPSAEMAKIKRDFDLVFNDAIGKGGPSVDETKYWRKEDIEEGKHLKPVEVTTLDRIGGKGTVMIFPRASGGLGKRFAWRDKDTGAKTVESEGEKNWLKPFTITNKSFTTTGDGVENSAELGTLTIEIPDKKDSDWKPYSSEPVTVNRISGSKYAGYLNIREIRSKAEKIEKKGLSPIQIAQLDILPNAGLHVTGQILPDIPLIKDIGLEFELMGDELKLFKTFNTGDFKVPKPLVIRDSSLTIFVSTNTGLGLEGSIAFGIDKVGEGYIGGGASTAGGFYLKGEFGFDSDLFDPAIVSVEYKDNAFSFDGHLGIKQGKIRGVKSADFVVSYKQAEGRFDFTGTAELSLPGVKQASAYLSYSEAEGLIIGGTVDLTSDIPRLRSGKVEARVRRAPGEEKWSLFGAIEAELDIPGLTAAKFTGSYEDGFFEIGFKGGFKRGLASGTVEAGVTNRGVDENGKPLQGEPSDELLFFGTGSVTVRLSKWLEGTAAIKFDRDGGVSLTGTIAVPKEIELIPDSLTPDFGPIGPKIRVFIPIASVGIAGVDAVIEGQVGVVAKFGAGVLRNVSLTVHYDFDDEEAASATGTAQFYMPAEAGLNASLKVSVGGRVAVIRAGGKLTIGGEIGVKGEAKADVAVNWSRKAGLSIEAGLFVIGYPKLKLFVKGNLFVDIDVWIGSVRLWESDDWDIVDKELGSSLKFGFEVPPGASAGAKKIIYTEAGGLDLNFDDIERGKVIPSLGEIGDAFKDFVLDLV